MIVRYFEWGIFNKDFVFPVWEEITTVDDLKEARPLTRDEAVKIIQDCGYKLVYSCSSGQVFDSSDEQFKKCFEGLTVDDYI